MRQAIVMVLAVLLVFVIATATVIAMDAKRGALDTLPSTVIPAPRVVLLQCVEGMGGFQCVEVREREVTR